jgi:hypothetical protein
MVYVIQTAPEMNCNSLKHDRMNPLMRTIYVFYFDGKKNNDTCSGLLSVLHVLIILP